VSIYSNANSNTSISNIGQELSPGRTSIVLPMDILLKKPARRLKTKAKKRAALSHYIYTLMNEEKGCLQKIILENYKEQSPSTSGQGCCSNYNSTLRAFKEFNIHKPYIEGIPRKI